MCPKIPRGRHRGSLNRRSGVRIRDQSGAEYWISDKRAAQLVKDGLARPVPCRGGTKLQEVGTIRAVYSSKYLHDVYSPGLRLYRDDLIKTIGTSKTGKPPRAHKRAPDYEEAHVAMPKDGWRNGQNEDSDD